MDTQPVTLNWVATYREQVPGKTSCEWSASHGAFHVMAFLYDAGYTGTMDVSVSLGPLSRTVSALLPAGKEPLEFAERVSLELIKDTLESLKKHQEAVAQTSSSAEDSWDPLKRCVR